ncbi:MAG: acyl carrier protein [Rhodospirillales bacterium]
MMTRENILETLKTHLEELLEISPDDVTMESRLNEDLDIDSIDAVELIVRLQTLTGTRIPPAEFKAVRTIGDVVDCVAAVMKK